jgi:hypothetical protein
MEVDIPMKAWQQLAALAPPLAAGTFSESKLKKSIRTLEVGWRPQVLYSLLCNSGLSCQVHAVRLTNVHCFMTVLGRVNKIFM